MKKLTTVIMVLSLVLGGVALAAAADLNGLTKISDQEAREVRGMGMEFGPQFGGFAGLGNPDCPLQTQAITSAPQTRTGSQFQKNAGTPVGIRIQAQDRTCW